MHEEIANNCFELLLIYLDVCMYACIYVCMYVYVCRHNYVIKGVWGPHSHGTESSHKYRDPSYVAKRIIVNCQEYTISNEKKYKVTMYRHYKSKVYYYLDNTLVVAQHRSHGTICFRYHSKTFYNTPVVCSCSRQTLPHVFHCPCS